MRLLKYLFVVLLLLPVSARADGMLANKFTTASAGTSINNIGTAITLHKMTWNITVGSPASCTVALDSSVDGVTWTAGGVIAGQTCTSNGSSTVVAATVNYVRINVTALSAGTTISVTWNGYVNSPSGGGGSVVGPVLDCSLFAGADMGAKLNACYAAAPAAGAVFNATTFTSPQTISTAVNQNVPGVTQLCGIAITQTAAITISAAKASWSGCPQAVPTITKGANLDQITVTAANVEVSNLDLEGAKASFTGNGIVISGVTWVYIDHDIINGEAGNDIDNEAGTWVFESNNELTGWGTRAIFMNGSVDYASDNYINGDTTATNNAITCTSCESTVIHNWIQDSSAAHLVTQSGGNPLILTSNTFQEFGGYSAVSGAQVNMTGNIVFGGGTNGDAVQVTAVSTISSNTINGQNNGNGVTLNGANLAAVTDNVINLTATTSTSKSGILITGDILETIVTGNSIDIADGGARSPHNNGIQLLTTSGHMFNNIIDGNSVDGTASVDGLFYNNAGGLASNANNNHISNTSCTHDATCIKRTDAQNNSNYYSQSTSDGTVFASGGSTADIINQTIQTIAFASLPTAGNGSVVNCSDCTQGIAAASGAGGIINRVGGVWLSSVSGTSPTVSSGFGSGAAVVAGGVPSSFRLGIGTSNTGTGVVALPTAKTGWNCYATNVTTKNTNQATVLQTADTTATVTFQNYTDIMGTHVMTDNDVLSISCTPH